jgi:hypothetical protein
MKCAGPATVELYDPSTGRLLKMYCREHADEAEANRRIHHARLARWARSASPKESRGS